MELTSPASSSSPSVFNDEHSISSYSQSPGLLLPDVKPSPAPPVSSGGPKHSQLDKLKPFLFSQWYPTLKKYSMRGVSLTLSPKFREYMDADGLSVPDKQVEKKIIQTVEEYGAVFPKLNWSAPKDAAWILNPGQPLRCTTSSDVYTFLKASDFVSSDLEFTEGIMEMVLKKWYDVDRGREMRVFILNGKMVGVCQRDMNFYPHLAETGTQTRLKDTIERFWDDIQPLWKGPADCVMDILLTRSFEGAHIMDFNPFGARTDGLLFAFDDFRDGEVLVRMIDSAGHRACSRNEPFHSGNMLPLEVFTLSEGKVLEEFRDEWISSVKKAMKGEQSDSGSGTE